MAYTGIDKPSDYFNTKLYTGTGSSNAVTGVGFQPDWIWIKNRGRAEDHAIFDVVRGASNGYYGKIRSNDTSAQEFDSNGMSAIGSDGFTVIDQDQVNRSNDTYASWNWKAGTSFTNDASSTGVGTIDSAGSVNQDAGFSICTYTGTGSAGTIKHGLNQKPTFWMTKASEARAWYGWHQGFALGDVVNFNSTNAATTDTSLFSTTAPTSSVYNVGTSVGTNKNTITFVNYLFHEVAGYSKFGTYTANGNADGPFVYTGFKPAWVLCKKSSATGDWELYDNKRNGFNGGNVKVIPNANDAETGVGRLSLLSNGFKITTSSGNLNTNNADYIYLAFAESPFVTSTGIPTPAR